MKKIWNWIKNIFKPEKQDPHIVLYEAPKPTHCPGHLRFKKNCVRCQEIVR